MCSLFILTSIRHSKFKINNKCTHVDETYTCTQTILKHTHNNQRTYITYIRNKNLLLHRTQTSCVVSLFWSVRSIFLPPYNLDSWLRVPPPQAPLRLAGSVVARFRTFPTFFYTLFQRTHIFSGKSIIIHKTLEPVISHSLWFEFFQDCRTFECFVHPREDHLCAYWLVVVSPSTYSFSHLVG